MTKRPLLLPQKKRYLNLCVTLVWFTVCLRALYMKHCTHKSVMDNEKTPPITSKRALPNLYLFKTLPSTPKKSVLPQRSPQNDQLFYLFKTPPSYVKKNGTILCIYSKRPSYLKKSSYYHKKPIKWISFCIYSKRPPPFLDSCLIVKKYKSDLYIILNGQQLVLARFSPVSTPFLPGRRHPSGSGAPPSGVDSS